MGGYLDAGLHLLRRVQNKVNLVRGYLVYRVSATRQVLLVSLFKLPIKGKLLKGGTVPGRASHPLVCLYWLSGMT
jgi:hypothetical protein